MYNITNQVRSAVEGSGVQDGIAFVFSPHTTAGITINENADPDVVEDMILGMDKAYPNRNKFRHIEGNSSAHLKTSAIGAGETVIVYNGRLLLGQWQGIYFCEFDGSRDRTFYVKVLAG
jgi:secondary thiamine-phosphate synthase enzyme